MVFGHARRFTFRPDADGDKEIFAEPQPALHKSALLIRSTSFRQVGEFLEQPGRHDFLDWYARAQAAGLRAAILPEVVVERRIHDSNVGRLDPAAQQQRYLSTLRAAVQQRRSSLAGKPLPPDEPS